MLNYTILNTEHGMPTEYCLLQSYQVYVSERISELENKFPPSLWQMRKFVS